jgi:hypothetical protein
MSQSAIIVLAFVLSFVVFVTMKEQLPTYLGVLGLGC